MTEAVRMVLRDMDQGASLDEALARVGMSGNDTLRANVLAELAHQQQ
jgi:Flp pilus assembly protein TadB